MILLDIPQEAITIASAILVVVGGALVTFAVFLVRELLSVKERLRAVETLVPPNEAQQMKSPTLEWKSYGSNICTKGSPM